MTCLSLCFLICKNWRVGLKVWRHFNFFILSTELHAYHLVAVLVIKYHVTSLQLECEFPGAEFIPALHSL